MKITLNEKETKDEIKFPCLMQGEDGSVVFFITNKWGTVIHTNVDGKKRLGDNSVYWDMSKFKIFKGSITLEND